MRRQLARIADPRQLRARWLAALSQVLDGYLRSPLFLACMRHGLAATLGARSLPPSLFPGRARVRSRLAPTPRR